MKVLLVLAIAIYGANAALSSAQVDEKWATFKVAHNKSYSAKEELMRKAIFQKTLEKIEAHNAKYEKGEETWTMGVNFFADMTKEEMKPWTHGLIQPEVEPEPLYYFKPSAVRSHPDAFDWRDQGKVTGVKNQGGCGSCWAFSSTGAIESQERIAGADVSASEQQLVDCTPNANGCSGGWMTDAFTYVAQNGGIDSESSYPYEAADGSCRYNGNNVVARLKGYAYLTGPDENALAELVYTNGPVAVAFDADNIGSYDGGVFYDSNCDPNKFTHAVLIVGYGNDNGQDFWWVKNSWGDGWGLSGYFKMARNRDNNCGIASKASVPVLA